MGQNEIHLQFQINSLYRYTINILNVFIKKNMQVHCIRHLFSYTGTCLKTHHLKNNPSIPQLYSYNL